MTEPIIRLEHVTRTYHVGDIDVHALRDVTVTINAGEFVTIVGSSGSGKSTLMAVIGCLDRPSSGSYFFEGADVANFSEPERARLRSERLGFVFQSFNLLSRTSALENVALPLFYAASGPAGASSRVERARASLKLLGLGDRERNTPGQLSGGQQQRVAIARALINAPGLLLADEPTGNLDTRTSHEIMETLVRLNREQGVTVIVVTHEADIAAYADRTLTMRDGQIVSDVRNPKPAVAVESPRGAAPGAGPPMPQPPRPFLATARRTNTFWSFAVMIMAAAMQAIWRNMMRSALTMLGVFIGVAALIAMVAVGQGANDAVRKQIERLGTNLVVVLPGARTAGGMRAGSGSASTLTTTDAQAILRESTAVGEISYLIRQSGQVEFGNQNWATQIQGISPNYPPMTNWRIDAGREITPDDEASAALVVVIGQTVSKQLFGEQQNPVGALIQVKGVPLRVIGVLESKGQTSFGQDQDDLVMIPFTTAERKVLGVAAPSQAQTQLNWIYPSPPNPYGLTPHLGRLRQPDLRAGRQFDGRAAGDPPDHRDSRAPPPHQARRRQRFLRAQSEPDRGSRRELEPHHGAPARRRRLDFAGGRRHRHHEHSAGVGDRADARDRLAHGDRRAARARAAAVPGRGGIPERYRRRRRHPHGRGVLGGHLRHRRLGGADLGHGDCRRVPVLGRGRHFLRLLSGPQSRASRSDRGAALRIIGAGIPTASGWIAWRKKTASRAGRFPPTIPNNRCLPPQAEAASADSRART